MSRRLPRHPFPYIAFPLVAGGRWSLAEHPPQLFVILIVFRLAYCSFCRRQLPDIDNHCQNLIDLGVIPAAVSGESKERIQMAVDEVTLLKLALGFDRSLDIAKPLGLYVSSRSKELEPEIFFEPEVSLIRRDHRLFMIATQNMAFGRSTMREALEAITVRKKMNISARGQLHPATLGSVPSNDV